MFFDVLNNDAGTACERLHCRSPFSLTEISHGYIIGSYVQSRQMWAVCSLLTCVVGVENRMALSHSVGTASDVNGTDPTHRMK